MSAIILVGGEGRRLSAVAPGKPKPLVEVAGQPFLHWVTRWAEAQGEHHIVLAACHMADQVQAWADAEGKARPTANSPSPSNLPCSAPAAALSMPPRAFLTITISVSMATAPLSCR